MTIDSGFSVVVATKRGECIKNLLNNYNRQNFQQKELIILIHNDQLDIETMRSYCSGRQDIRIEQVPEKESLGNCLNIGFEKAKYGYVAKMDDDDYYGIDYLQEAYHLFIKEKCDIVCKMSIFYYLKEFEELVVYPQILDYTRKTKGGAGATICMTKELFRKIKYSDLRQSEDVDLFARCREIPGIRVYSTSSYNFLCIRNQDVQEHTWQVSGAVLRQRANVSFGNKKMTMNEACQFVECRNHSVFIGEIKTP